MLCKKCGIEKSHFDGLCDPCWLSEEVLKRKKEDLKLVVIIILVIIVVVLIT
jgi:NMD protein affecting ribosome stability and mRNA decay